MKKVVPQNNAYIEKMLAQNAVKTEENKKKGYGSVNPDEGADTFLRSDKGKQYAEKVQEELKQKQ